MNEDFKKKYWEIMYDTTNGKSWTYNKNGYCIDESWTYSKDDGVDLSEASLLEHVLSVCEEGGFLGDVLDHLRRVAPRKVHGFLKRLRFSGDLGYEFLCSCVYGLEIRMSEVVERRMVMGSMNKWVRSYFEDFPLGT